MITGHHVQYIGDGYTIRFDGYGFADLWDNTKRVARFGPNTLRALKTMEIPEVHGDHDVRPYGGD